MQKIFVTLGIACFVLAGGMSADLISSSISVDGSSWIKSSLTGDKTYSGLLFTNDQSTVNRTIDFSKDLDTHTRISSTGPVGIQEYSAQASIPESEVWRCMFARSDDETPYEEIETRGILASGNYTAVRGMSEDLTSGGVDITGSGLVSLSKKTGTVNRTQEERSVAAGRMNVSEYGEYGGES
nr:hypothetical protein [uncultured Methanospirillum sp.]